MILAKITSKNRFFPLLIIVALANYAEPKTVPETRRAPEVGPTDILLDLSEQITENWSVTNNCVYANDVVEYSDFCHIPEDTEPDSTGYWSPCNIPTKKCLFVYNIPKSNSSAAETIVTGIQLRAYFYGINGYYSVVDIKYKNPEDTEFTAITITGKSEWRIINSPLISLKEEATIEIQLSITGPDRNAALDYILLKGVDTEN